MSAEEELSQPVAWAPFLLFTLSEDFDWQSLRSVAMMIRMIVMVWVTKRQFLLWICHNLEKDIYAMYIYVYMYIVNSRWGRDRVASDILTPFPEIYSAHTMLYLLLCVVRFWSESQSISSVVRLSVSGVWGEWVPLSTVCPRQKRGFVPHHSLECGAAMRALVGRARSATVSRAQDRRHHRAQVGRQTKRSRAQTSCAELKLEELAPMDLKQNKHDCQQQNLLQ